MFLGCLLLLFLTTGLGMIAEGSFDFIYVIIIGMLAIAYPILCYIMLFLYNPQDQLMDIIFPIMVTIAELIGIIFLSSKFLIKSNTKKNRKVIGYILITTSVLCILLIIIRCLIALL